MTKWLSPDWFDETWALVGGQQLLPGLSTRIEAELTGGPDGDVKCYWTVEEGRLEAGAVGTIERPDITLTMSWMDAASLLSGRARPKCGLHAGTVEGGGVDGCDDRHPHSHDHARIPGPTPEDCPNDGVLSGPRVPVPLPPR